MIDPWGGSADELVQKIVDYSRVLLAGAKVLGGDPTKFRQLKAVVDDSKAAPEHVVSIDTGAIHMFGSGPTAVKRLKELLGQYDKYFARSLQIYEE